MRHRFDALIFDFDGTLIDSAPDICAAINHILTAAGRAPVDLAATKKMIGNGAPKLIERAFEATGNPLAPDAVQSTRDAFFAFYMDPERPSLTRPYPGAVEALARHAESGVKIGLCTNKSQHATEFVLKKLGLSGFFATVLGGDKAPIPKPHGDHLRAVLSALEVDTDDAVMIGDSHNDIDAARDAGVANIAVTFGYPKSSPYELGADAVITSFAELDPALCSL